MKETLKRTQFSAIVGILTIVGLFAGIVVLAAIMYVLANAFGISFMEYIEYALFIFIGVLIIQKWITEYEYAVVDDEFFVDRYLGKHPKRLFGIKLKSITYMGKQLPKDYSGKKQRLTYKSKRSGVVYIIYQSNGEKKCAYFSPSQKLLDIMGARRKSKA